MVNEILGKGWKFPVTIGPAGIADSRYEDNIKETIRIILATAKGERVMRPDFGCGIHDYVFQIVNTTSVSLMKSSVVEALRTFEPRIEVTDIAVDTQEVSRGKVTINIAYRVISTNNQFNLVYPFYLTEGR